MKWIQLLKQLFTVWNKGRDRDEASSTHGAKTTKMWPHVTPKSRNREFTRHTCSSRTGCSSFIRCLFYVRGCVVFAAFGNCVNLFLLFCVICGLSCIRLQSLPCLTCCFICGVCVGLVSVFFMFVKTPRNLFPLMHLILVNCLTQTSRLCVNSCFIRHMCGETHFQQDRC